MRTEEVAQAVALQDDGRQIRYIAEMLGHPRSTVSDAIQRFRQTGSYSRRPGQGRRRATNAVEDRFLRLQALRERTASAPALARRLADVRGTFVSPDTVRRRLREQNLTSRVPATGPLLDAVHRRQRLEFARDHSDWDINDWQNVLFTDESRFTRYSPDGRQRVWRRPGERYSQCCFSPRVQFGGGGVMVWGGISLEARTDLVILQGGINADRYIRQCLEEHVVPYMPFIGENFLLMHDNARPHIAQITRQYLNDVDVQVLDWPSRSPDLNPIEHMWDTLGRRVRQNYGEFQTLDALAQALTNEWQQIPEDAVAALIESMPERMRAVIQARGGNTRF